MHLKHGACSGTSFKGSFHLDRRPLQTERIILRTSGNALSHVPRTVTVKNWFPHDSCREFCWRGLNPFSEGTEIALTTKRTPPNLAGYFQQDPGFWT